MKNEKEVKDKLVSLYEDLGELFRQRDAAKKRWEYQEYHILICNKSKEISLLEWVLK